MKTGKTLKLAGALAASLALLAVLAGCGQSSKPSSQKDSTSSTSQFSTHPSSSSPLPSTSTSTASSSSTSASASNIPSSSNASSTPAASASSSAPSSTTESRPSNEVLYLLAYIKYRGGLEAITPSDLIVDKYMIGTQKGTVLPNTLPTQVPLQMVVSGEEVEVIGPPSTPENSSTYSLKAVYNIDDLVSEYYSTPSQKEQVNSILQEGERHNLLDVLALLKAMQVKPAEYYEEGTIEYASPEGSNSLAIGADTSALIVINGEDVTICISGAAGAGYPVHYSYSHYEASELLSEYYSTIAQQTAINKNIDAAIKGYME